MLCGDFNARTSSCIPDDSRLSFDRVDFDIDKPVVRVQSWVRIIVLMPLASTKYIYVKNLTVILNRLLLWDSSGDFTYNSPNGSSVIDYFLISAQLVTLSQTLHVASRDKSQHIPVELCLTVSRKPSSRTYHHVLERNVCGYLKDQVYSWNVSSQMKFKNILKKL